MGEGGLGRGVAVLAAFVIVGIVLFATIDDAQNGSSGATDQTTTTAPVGDAPCGGAAEVPAAVKASSVGGLSGSAALYDVTDVRIAASDPTWGRFSTVPKSGQQANFQNGYGVVQCTLLGWAVTDYGSSGVGCAGTNPPPAAVRSDLALTCPN
jgi:hypothetical protein